MSLPPVFAASALYDSLLQTALRQFFSRATFETEPIPSLSSDGRLAIEPTSDPSVLSIRWFGMRHVLHVPARRPFTEHEVRLAQGDRHGAGRPLPRDLRSEDRCSSAASCSEARSRTATSAPSWSIARAGEEKETRADVVANAIEVLRVAGLSSYENRTISSGVMLLEGDTDPVRSYAVVGRAGVSVLAGADRHQELLPAVRRPAHAVSGEPERRGARSRRSVRDMRGPRSSTSRGRPPIARTRWRPRRRGTSASC